MSLGLGRLVGSFAEHGRPVLRELVHTRSARLGAPTQHLLHSIVKIVVLSFALRQSLKTETVLPKLQTDGDSSSALPSLCNCFSSAL